MAYKMPMDGTVFSLRMGPVFNEIANDKKVHLPKTVFAEPIIDVRSGKIIEFVVHLRTDAGATFVCPAVIFAHCYHVAGDVIA